MGFSLAQCRGGVNAASSPEVALGSKCEELRVGKVSPLYPTKRTSTKGVATSLMGHNQT